MPHHDQERSAGCRPRRAIRPPLPVSTHTARSAHRSTVQEQTIGTFIRARFNLPCHESRLTSATVMKQKRIEAHKIGLVGQAPSRRGDPRKPLAGPNGQKIARLAGMSYDELIACRRKHLNTHYSGKRRKGDAFDRAKANLNAADVLMDSRVERIVLLGKNVARCFGFRDLPFLAEIRIYGR